MCLLYVQGIRIKLDFSATGTSQRFGILDKVNIHFPSKATNNKGADQTAQKCRFICIYALCIRHNACVFSNVSTLSYLNVFSYSGGHVYIMLYHTCILYVSFKMSSYYLNMTVMLMR